MQLPEGALKEPSKDDLSLQCTVPKQKARKLWRFNMLFRSFCLCFAVTHNCKHAISGCKTLEWSFAFVCNQMACDVKVVV